MKAFRDLSLQRKLTLAILVTSIVPLGIAAVLVLGYQLTNLRADAARALVARAELLAVSARASLEFDDAVRARELLATLRSRPELVAVGIYARDGRVFASYRRTDAAALAFPPLPAGDAGAVQPVGNHLAFFHPIRSGPDTVGHIYLRSDLAVHYAPLPQQGLIVLGVLAGLLLLAYRLSHEFQRLISRPILALADTAQVVAERKDYSVRAAQHGQDEIGTLTERFNKMLADIQARDNALQTANAALHAENTARTQAEEALRLLNASLEHRVQERTTELQAANLELESFSYSVSHDLRAPLRHIHGYVEMLTDATAGQLAEQPRRYLQTITEASEEMGELIDDLLAFSRMGRAEFTETRVPLDGLVQETLRGLELAVKGRNIQWQIPPLPPVLGDAAMLRQVLANLLGNAVKYSRGRDPAKIELGLAGEEAGRTIFFVRDNGAGFDMRYAHKLFGVFQRLHRADEFEGTGIGLATVRRIIVRHGGRVWAEAKPGAGATFYFTLRPDDATLPALTKGCP